MCGQCSLVQMGVSRESFLQVTSQLRYLPNVLAGDIFDAVTNPEQGYHLGEATFFATLAVAIDQFLAGARSENHNFELGFLMPLSAHDRRLDGSGVPTARYETTEMETLLESFRRMWMSDTVRTSLEHTLKTHGLALPAFACSGVAVVPFDDRDATLAWYRTSGWQHRRAQVDQGQRTFDRKQFRTIADLPESIDLSQDQTGAIIMAYEMAERMIELECPKPKISTLQATTA